MYRVDVYCSSHTRRRAYTYAGPGRAPGISTSGRHIAAMLLHALHGLLVSLRIMLRRERASLEVKQIAALSCTCALGHTPIKIGILITRHLPFAWLHFSPRYCRHTLSAPYSSDELPHDEGDYTLAPLDTR